MAQMGNDLREQFEEQGFIEPVPILNQGECEEVLRRLRPYPPDWFKGNAACCRSYYQVASRTDILDLVRLLLGEDILLWGATLTRKKAGVVHPWHTDVETSGEGRAVTVWIGLENTNPNSSLQIISHSHRFGESVQYVASQAEKGRNNVTTDDVLAWQNTAILAAGS